MFAAQREMRPRCRKAGRNLRGETRRSSETWDDYVMGRGDEELGRRAADLARRLPEALAPLARIA